MCKKKDKKDAQKVAVVGTAGAVGYTVGTTAANVKSSEAIVKTPSSGNIGKSTPQKELAKRTELTTLEILLKILHGIKIAAMAIGFILALFTLLGFIYLFLALTGVVEPDPHAFFGNLGF